MNKNNLYKRMYSPMHGLGNNAQMDYTEHNKRNEQPKVEEETQEVDINEVMNQISALQDELNTLRNTEVTKEPEVPAEVSNDVQEEEKSDEQESDAQKVLRRIGETLVNTIK